MSGSQSLWDDHCVSQSPNYVQNPSKSEQQPSQESKESNKQIQAQHVPVSKLAEKKPEAVEEAPSLAAPVVFVSTFPFFYAPLHARIYAYSADMFSLVHVPLKYTLTYWRVTPLNTLAWKACDQNL